MFECPLDKLDVLNVNVDCSDIATAIILTKEYLTTGKLPTIMVRRMRNGRYYVRTNIIAYYVAHTLSLPTIPAQEIENADIERSWKA